jgi:hypothetical protein
MERNSWVDSTMEKTQPIYTAVRDIVAGVLAEHDGSLTRFEWPNNQLKTQS